MECIKEIPPSVCFK